MRFPTYRPRRVREQENLRRMVRETRLSVDHFIYPLFVVPGEGIRQEIRSMPGCFHLSVDRLLEEVKEAHDLGIPAVMLFGLPEEKDALGSSGYADDGIIPRAVSALKKAVPRITVITDVCLCEYTSHGHCGV
ncbi:MAG: porphobilinogen synthase, partial [Nitrospinae bacterium]|nr:porphobilinogen synthase [Nitrospinota bacterium]